MTEVQDPKLCPRVREPAVRISESPTLSCRNRKIQHGITKYLSIFFSLMTMSETVRLCSKEIFIFFQTLPNQFETISKELSVVNPIVSCESNSHQLDLSSYSAQQLADAILQLDVPRRYFQMQI